MPGTLICDGGVLGNSLTYGAMAPKHHSPEDFPTMVSPVRIVLHQRGKSRFSQMEAHYLSFTFYLKVERRVL